MVNVTERHCWQANRNPKVTGYLNHCASTPLPTHNPPPPPNADKGYRGEGGVVGLGWVKASPGRLPTVRAAFPAGPDWAAVPGCPVTRPTGLLTAPRPRGGARGREMPPCLCVCALVSLGGGGRAVAHLLAPLLFGVGAHGAGKCVPGAPGPGREAGEPDSEPAGGDVGLGSQPPRHKDMLPNHSTTACWQGMVVVRGTTGVRPALLDCLRHRWCCHAGLVRLPTAEGVPRAGGGAPGRRECFPAQGATGAGCTGCGATAHVDKGAQRAPHPNGLSVVARGGLGGATLCRISLWLWLPIT